MKAAYLRWNKIWQDEFEHFYHMEVFATNSRTAATVECYIHPNAIIDFAHQLLTFPQNLAHEVVLECGEDIENSWSYLLFRAYVYDRLGHVALEVKMRTNGSAPLNSFAHFSIATEAVSLNQLGATLADWAVGDEPTYEHEIYLY